MTGWQQLNDSLDAAAERGETIRFWWRDDDAGRESPSLSRLLELAGRCNLPLALAVVPAWLQADAQGQIAARGNITVLQHGFSHENHAPEGAKSIELGGRAAKLVNKELRQGLIILQDAFGAAFLPVLVPPWNRIDPSLHECLPAAGYIGLSVFGRRVDREIMPGVSLVNTHLDPVDWRGTRGFSGNGKVLQQLIDHLDSEEPIGILSHHLVMDEPCWAFVEQLFATLSGHPAVRICSASDLFSPYARSSEYAP